MTKKLAHRIADANPLSLEELRAATTLTDDDKIYQLKLEGHSYREIAALVGIPVERVEETVIRMAERSRERLVAELSVGAILEVDRLDAQHKALWPAAKAGDYGAIDRVMKISQERRKLLNLDLRETLVGSSAEYDLSRLTDAEVAELERLHKKLAAPQTKALPTRRKAREGEVVDVPVEPLKTDSGA